jgi:hypothetical protein
MVFVVILVTGITLSISTCLKVWTRSEEVSALNQEVRATLEVLARDLRGTYMGLQRREGYFITGGDADETSSHIVAEFSTESSLPSRAALLPEDERATRVSELGEPLTDFVAVRYELRDASGQDPPGLYRLTWVAPQAVWREVPPAAEDAAAIELISADVAELHLLCFDGEEWLDGWQTSAEAPRPPVAVAVELTVLDANENEHLYESIIHVPAH